METSIKNIVDWDSDYVEINPEKVSLSEIVGQNLVIEHVSIGVSSNYGAYAELRDEEGQEYYTFSKLAIKQSRKVRDLNEEGKAVRVHIAMNNRRQVYFTEPIEE